MIADPTTSRDSEASPARRVLGLQPRLPQPLASMRWWTEPVRAERLAAFRIALGLVLVVDVLGTYWPLRRELFGPGSLGSPEIFASRTSGPLWNWSLLEGVTSPAIFDAALLAWAGAALLLAAGYWARPAAAVAWALTVSVMNVNYFIHNGGDRLRLAALFYLALCPCAAAWSIDAWRRNRKTREAGEPPEPVYVHPWPLRLMFLQLVAVYFFSGVLKEKGDTWGTGDALHLTITNLAWTRWSYCELALPLWCSRGLTWLTLVWEVGFPLWVLWRPTRMPALVIGATFHVLTGSLLKIGLFPIYALCWYLPLLPWERLADRGRAGRGVNGNDSAVVDATQRGRDLNAADAAASSGNTENESEQPDDEACLPVGV